MPTIDIIGISFYIQPNEILNSNLYNERVCLWHSTQHQGIIGMYTSILIQLTNYTIYRMHIIIKL